MKLSSSCVRPARLIALAGALIAHQELASAACLMKVKAGTAGMAAPVFMVAPAIEVPSYVSAGFSTVACPTDRSVLRQYVDRICSTSTEKSTAAINTSVLFGRSRDKACASARAGLAEVG
jgi:hypothetical protein